MRERVVRFGKSASLVGIQTDAISAQREERPGVILVNSGILHRVGACRLHVRLARALAEMGFSTLRFDFSGIGDSPVRRDDLVFEESAVLEIQEAMDSLGASNGARTFVLMGLCSGADMAFRAAQVDARVVGLGLLDPWVYRTPFYYWKRYASRLMSASAWIGSFQTRFGSGHDPNSFPPIANEENDQELELPTYVREFPTRQEAEADLRRLMKRNLQLCCVFSGGQSEHYNYEGQFRSVFRATGLEGRLKEIFQPSADHIFTDLVEQEKLLGSLLSWTSCQFDPSSHEEMRLSASEVRQAG